jgi:serine/threonine-protein kinase
LGQTIGSYQVVRLLGRGGCGEVYLARHPVIRVQVAIKILLPELAVHQSMVDRFVREAQAASLIVSPHIVRVSDFGCLADGRHYAVMEYVEGVSLQRVLQQERCLRFGRAKSLLGQIAAGMVAAHAAGILHRDLKSANIFLSKRRVKIGDLNVAKESINGLLYT